MKENGERFGESFAEMYISRVSGPPDAFLVNVLANVFNLGVIVSPGSGDVINFIVLSLNHQRPTNSLVEKTKISATTDVTMLHSPHNHTI